jgi:5-methylcytosine-specific restriction endonuclease McrA
MEQQRGSAAQRGYGSPEHRAWRRTVIKRDKLCRDCHQPLLDARGEPLPTAHADHIIPKAAGGAPFDLANGAGRCNRCHSRKTIREQRDPFLGIWLRQTGKA